MQSVRIAWFALKHTVAGGDCLVETPRREVFAGRNDGLNMFLWRLSSHNVKSLSRDVVPIAEMVSWNT